MSNASSNRPRLLERLQERLAYRFADVELLELALTHKSFAQQNNERLEFIGDAVLGYVIGIELYRQHRGLKEDVLSLMRAQLVRGSTLAELARELELGDCLRVGAGERRSGGRHRDSILADALEALVGAVHEDSYATHGAAPAISLVQRLFEARLTRLSNDALDDLLNDLKDAKTQLQEHLQGRKLPLPEYEVVATEGAEHARRYTMRCTVPSLDVAAEAEASSRRAAEKLAAEKVLALLDQRDG